MGKIHVKPKEQTFRTQIGQKATVSREQVSNEQVTKANAQLDELGTSLNPVPTSLKYMGSAAVHIYWNETFEQVFFISQVAPLEHNKCPEILAAKSFDDLVGTMKELYGKKRSLLRSGF